MPEPAPEQARLLRCRACQETSHQAEPGPGRCGTGEALPQPVAGCAGPTAGLSGLRRLGRRASAGVGRISHRRIRQNHRRDGSRHAAGRRAWRQAPTAARKRKRGRRADKSQAHPPEPSQGGPPRGRSPGIRRAKPATRKPRRRSRSANADVGRISRRRIRQNHRRDRPRHAGLVAGSTGLRWRTQPVAG